MENNFYDDHFPSDFHFEDVPSLFSQEELALISEYESSLDSSPGSFASSPQSITTESPPHSPLFLANPIPAPVETKQDFSNTSQTQGSKKRKQNEIEENTPKRMKSDTTSTTTPAQSVVTVKQQPEKYNASGKNRKTKVILQISPTGSNDDINFTEDAQVKLVAYGSGVVVNGAIQSKKFEQKEDGTILCECAFFPKKQLKQLLLKSRLRKNHEQFQLRFSHPLFQTVETDDFVLSSRRPQSTPRQGFSN